MSSHHQIFVRQEDAEREFPVDVAAASGTVLNEVDDAVSEEIAYAGTTENTAVEIELSHDFEDDYGIPFSAYPMIVTIRDLDRDLERQESLARDVYGRLGALGGYSLLLVFDLSTLLERS
ncbi:MAG: hypothetical protein ACRDP6_13885 [Actinoallomurus sp.]